MKFGKYLEARQLELPEYNGYFINYKALKKLIKKLSLQKLIDANNNNLNYALKLQKEGESKEGEDQGSDEDSIPSYKNLQCNKAMFFFKVERELEKVNEYYLERENNFKIMIEVLQKKFDEYQQNGRLTSKSSSSFKYLFESLKRYQRDLNHLTQYVELNRTGFSKVLKKWDKRSHSHTKDFYLTTIISVQSVFTRSTEISQLNDMSINLLMELDDIRQEVPSGGPSSNIAGSGSVTSQFNNTSDVVNSFTLDIELEIDIWFKEVINISQLKDLEPRLQLLKNFPHKIIQFIDAKIAQKKENKEDIIKRALTKLFYLLISSEKIDDECLETFFISCKGLSQYLDFLFLDDEDSYVFTRRNFFHEAASCQYFERSFILTHSIEFYGLENEQFVSYLNSKDFNDRTPLHYAAELGKMHFVKSLVDTQVLDTIHSIDKNSNTALILSISNNHPNIVKILLTSYSNIKDHVNHDTDPLKHQSPLNIACINKNYEITKLILDTILKGHSLEECEDLQGYKPLHVAAENGAGTDLLKLLCDYGCNVNSIDSVNYWTPLLYAVNNGYVDTVESLISVCGADVDICDDKSLSPIFYACWQGHIDVINVLMKHKPVEEKRSSVMLSCSVSQHEMSTPLQAIPPDPFNLGETPVHSVSFDIDGIPDFTLPPPIIPLRKYGHNFLEKKLFLKLHFKSGLKCIMLNEEHNGMVSPTNLGRITLTSNIVDLISRNISLPIESTTSYYYTDVGFSPNTSNIGNGINNGNGVDSTDEIIFQINSLDTCVIDLEIYPVSGTRMVAKTVVTSEILKNSMDKAVNQGSVILPLLDSRLKLIGQILFDFQIIYPFTSIPLEITQFETYWKSTGDTEVTSSSLSGDYLTLLVTLLNDGTVVVAPKLTISNNGSEMLLLDLSAEQVEKIIGTSLNDVSALQKVGLELFLQENYVKFEDLLGKLPSNTKIDIKVCFPTDNEVRKVPVKLTSPFVNIDSFVDDVLSYTLLFIQNTGSSSSKTIVFSSSNHTICSILNWKQPVFPVIFNMNGVIQSKVDNSFEVDSQNHLIHMALQKTLAITDFNYRSIKDVMNFAKNNNLLGVIIPADLLILCDRLIEEIKLSGLLLIAGGVTSMNQRENRLWNHSKINGFKTSRYLKFKDE